MSGRFVYRVRVPPTGGITSGQRRVRVRRGRDDDAADDAEDGQATSVMRPSRSRTGIVALGLATLAALAVMIALIAIGPSDGGDGDGPVTLAGLPGGAMTVGAQDDLLAVEPVDTLAQRMDRLDATGISISRFDVLWAEIAPARPADPRNPDDPAYNWQRIDAVIDGLDRREIAVIVAFSRPPGWANGEAGPSGAPVPDEYAAFVRAFAERYDGDGHAKVDLFEPWNEPNNPVMLMPQWEGAGTSATPVAPATYATLVQRARTELREANGDARIIGPSLADIETSAAGVGGIGVQDFLEALVPLRPSFDATSQHLVPTVAPGAPSSRIPSIGALPRLLALMDEVAPGRDLLITQVGYATTPGGLSDAQQAQFVTQVMSVLAANGRVRAGIWSPLQDTLDRPAGLITTAGAPKPSLEAFTSTPKSLPSERP